MAQTRFVKSSLYNPSKTRLKMFTKIQHHAPNYGVGLAVVFNRGGSMPFTPYSRMFVGGLVPVRVRVHIVTMEAKPTSKIGAKSHRDVTFRFFTFRAV